MNHLVSCRKPICSVVSSHQQDTVCFYEQHLLVVACCYSCSSMVLQIDEGHFCTVLLYCECTTYTYNLHILLTQQHLQDLKGRFNLRPEQCIRKCLPPHIVAAFLFLRVSTLFKDDRNGGIK